MSLHILTINAGSSSLKLALFGVEDSPKKSFEAVIDDIGSPAAAFAATGAKLPAVNKPVAAPDHQAAARLLTDWLKQVHEGTIDAIGHRIVHGGPKYYEPHVIDDTVMEDLGKLTLFDPEHLPIELQLIGVFQALYPNATQTACFDTAFHHDLPNVARLLPIPRQYAAKGIRRYGFHGVSYAFVLSELERLEGAEVAQGRLILAHLGNGVSLTAVHQGKSIDTTMGLTPASGVPMSSRAGDLDPGLA
ncbi:MAG TPA: hypothetical protein VIJ68_04935, partial [Candidatus Saccharimonadales bacterium]